MQRAVLTAMVLGVLAGGVSGRAGDGKTDRDKIQGDWELVSQVAGGENIALPEGGMVLSFKGDKVTVIENKKADKEDPFKLNEAKNPREIDVLKPDLTVRGLYELKGDTLKMAFLKDFDKRPAAFDDKEAGVLTFKRVVKK
jgi:uncharacterized protein (TIGR03067 family)